MNYNNIEIEINNQVATIWLNRPNYKNALDGDTFSELLDYLTDIKRNANIRLLVLRGKGEVFSSGADLNWMLASGKKSRIKNLLESRLIAKCLLELYSIPFPTIAVVHGLAFGGALGLVSACDIVVCHEGTKFCFSEVRLGLAPSTIMPYVLKRINKGMAANLFFTARKFDALEAIEFGLVDMIVEQGTAETDIKILINSILKASPNALKECKRMMHECSAGISPKLLNKTIVSLTELKRSADGLEGLTAFSEKRKPAWDNCCGLGIIRCTAQNDNCVELK